MLWVIFTVIIGMWIWQENSGAVLVSYFGFQFHEQTLGEVMASMLVAGFTLGALPLLFAGIMRESTHRRNIKRIQKQMDKHERMPKEG